ncbi:hypothetical protein HNQ60_004025 [Povalibacter uvarum]|uniref:Uncharacterized protein n=1 Tax=Povalibacter uvarum TaxID=732238 RepID=A0A841HTF9_9GAMM|nr:hypothetical protein [Povalibacter uvarum]MBB6095135.1 hypothetical protein [Povalibacter uvarum]
MTRRFARRAMLLAALATLASPIASQAAGTHGVDACMKKFINGQLPEGTTVRIGEPEGISGADFRLGSRPRIVVHAVGETTGKDYGSARCVVNRRGDLVAMYVGNVLVYAAGQRTDPMQVAVR